MKMGTSHLSFRHLVLCLIAVTIASVGCSSKKNDQAGLSLSVPQYQSLSKGVNAQSGVGELTHVFISITGPNIAVPISFEWSQCKECTNKLSAPSSFKLGVPTGDSRLIQVLVVYEDDSSGATGIYYGDVTQSLVSGDNSVGVNVTSILQTNNLIEGRIAGRYIDKTELVNVSGVTQPVAYGPTGEVLIKYKPLNKPAMTIDRSSIVNGWMNFFALKDINFNYEMPDGRILFQNVNLDSFKPNTTGAVPGKYAHVWMPQHYRQYDAGQTPEKEDEKIHILGWFGRADLSSFEVCMPDAGSTTTLPPLFARDSSNLKGGNLILSYQTSLVQPTSGSTTVNVTNATQRVAGTNCDLGKIYETLHFIGKESLINGNDSVGGVRGTMALFYNSPDFVFSKQVTTPSAEIQFSVLPGIPVVTTAFEHWQADAAILQGRRFDNIPCRAIRNNLLTGFTLQRSVNTSLATRGLAFPMQTTDYSKINVFCPVFNNFTLDTGFMLWPHMAASNVDMKMIVTQSQTGYSEVFMNAFSQRKSFVTLGACHTLEVKFNSPSGTTLPSTITLSDFPSASLHSTSDTTCATAAGSSSQGNSLTVALDTTTNSYRLNFKTTSSTASLLSINYNGSDISNLPAANRTWQLDMAPVRFVHDILQTSLAKYSTSACYKARVNLAYHTFNGFNLNIGESTLTRSAFFSSVAYDDPGCTTGATNTTLTSTFTYKYFKLSGVGPYNLLSSSPGLYSEPISPLETTDSTTGLYYRHIIPAPSANFQSCRAFDLVTVNSNLSIQPSVGSVSITATSANSTSLNIFTEPMSCFSGAGGTTNLSLTEASHKLRIWVREDSASAGVVVTSSSPTIITTAGGADSTTWIAP